MDKLALIAGPEEFFWNSLFNCQLCPRKCSVNRLAGEVGFCNHHGEKVWVAAACDHHGEEPPISGTKGSGTIFFSHCNLKCSYCQNFQISSNDSIPPNTQSLTTDQLAELMLKLQRMGLHNINLVTPTPFIAHIIRALKKAIQSGLKIPIVFNCGGYESVEVIKKLEGIIDIYLPDFKYSNNSLAEKYSHCNDYFENAQIVFKEIYQQKGWQLKLDDNNIATSGLIVRHLILPGVLENSKNVFQFLAENLSPKIHISLMAQFNPTPSSPIKRRTAPSEYEEIIDYVLSLGFCNGQFQELDSSDLYNPEFSNPDHPFIKI